MTYISRLVDTELALLLDSLGGVLIEGPMGCGKSETARRVSRREINFDLDLNAQNLLGISPESLLNGPYPTLFDEWQAAPGIWNQARHAVDIGDGTGKFIFTGSATPEIDKTRHPGTGRFSRIRMRPLTLAESQISNSSVSLISLLAGEAQIKPSPNSEASFGNLLRAIIRGGYPAQQGAELNRAAKAMRSYVEQIPRMRQDYIPTGLRSPATMQALLLALARVLGAELNYARLARDVAVLHAQVAESTIAEYVHTLEKMFFVTLTPPWYSHLRSNIRISQRKKLYFADPSIPAALLGATESSLLEDLETTGFLFENLVHRDLSVFLDQIGGEITHYRDKANLEVDFIIRTNSGLWAPIEVKLGPARAQDGIVTIERLVRKVNVEKMGQPAFKAVITTGEYSYRDPDTNTFVISIFHLGL